MKPALLYCQRTLSPTGRRNVWVIFQGKQFQIAGEQTKVRTICIVVFVFVVVVVVVDQSIHEPSSRLNIFHETEILFFSLVFRLHEHSSPDLCKCNQLAFFV